VDADALPRVGIQAVPLCAKSRRFDDLDGGRRVFVTVALSGTVEGSTTDEKLRLVAKSPSRQVAKSPSRQVAKSPSRLVV